MNIFSNPTFWEVVGGIIVVLALIPVAYLLFVVVCVLFLARRYDRPSASVHDPVFGELQFFQRMQLWEGIASFRPVQAPVMIQIAAGESGPSKSQRALFHQIEQKYVALWPQIQKALVQYVERDWDFKLDVITIAGENDSHEWTASYHAKTEDDGDMGYDVDVADWTIKGITCGD